MKRFVFASLLGLALFASASTPGGVAPAMAQGKIYYGPGGSEYRSAETPTRPNVRRGDGDRRGYDDRRGGYSDRRGGYSDPREYRRDSGYRRGYGPRTGYYYDQPRRYYRW
jgi:hypothetical protein